MQTNVLHTSSMSPDKIPAHLDTLEKNPELLRQFALCAFWGGLCQEWSMPVDVHLWMFVVRWTDGGSARMKLDEVSLRKCFLHFWGQWFWGNPFLHPGRREAAGRYLALGCPDLPRELVGSDFVRMLYQEGSEGYFPMDEDAVHMIKWQIRDRYAIEQADLFTLLDINGPMQAVSDMGKRVSGILA